LTVIINAPARFQPSIFQNRAQVPERLSNDVIPEVLSTGLCSRHA
jgi:hypothetical protein